MKPVQETVIKRSCVECDQTLHVYYDNECQIFITHHENTHTFFFQLDITYSQETMLQACRVCFT